MLAVAWAITGDTCYISRLIAGINPRARAENKDREQAYDDEQHPGERAGIAVLEPHARKGGVINFNGEKVERIARAAPLVCRDDVCIERLQRADDAGAESLKDHRRAKRNRDPKKFQR